MSFWKTICTCAGCIAGAVCVVASGGTLLPLVVAAGGGAIAGNLVGHKMDQDEKKTKNQEQALANQGKVIEELSQTNKKLQAEETKQNKNLEKLDDKIEHREKEIEEATKKSKDSSLSDNERKKWKSRLRFLLEEQDKDKKERDGVVDAIKKIKEQIANNNKNISSIGSGSSNKDKHPIMEFLTLENILIGFAIYALWQIVKDNKRY